MQHYYYTYDESLLISTLPRHNDLNFVFQRELPILVNLYQSMADGHVLAKQPDIPLEGLSSTEFCLLLRENIEALILNFHKANERVSVSRPQLRLLSTVTFVHTSVSLKRADINPP